MQKDLKIRKQRPTVKDTLKYGGMKLITDLLEVPTTQLGVGQVTMLVTLLYIVIRLHVMVVVDLGTKIKTNGVHGNNP